MDIIDFDMRNICEAVPDSWIITIKQNVQFQVVIYALKNGQLSAIINFNMPDISQTVPDILTIAMKQNVTCNKTVVITVILSDIPVRKRET